MDRDRGIPALVARCSLTGAEAGAGKLQIALTGAKVSADKGSGRFMLFIEFIVVQKQVSPLHLDKEYSCIPVANGYLDLYNLELIEPSKDAYNTVKVDIPYNPDCQFSERIE